METHCIAVESFSRKDLARDLDNFLVAWQQNFRFKTEAAERAAGTESRDGKLHIAWM